jgi:nitrogen fixation protein FixH
VAPFTPTAKRRAPGRAAGSPDRGGVTGRTVLVSLLAFFAVVIGVNVVMMTLAISTMPGIEVESPYLAGIKYNSEITAARAQADRGWRMASHIVRDADGRAVVTVEARDRSGAPLAGLAMSVRLARPTDARADHAVTLTERSGGTYFGEAADVIAGIWDFELEVDRGAERMFRSKNRISLD